MKYYLITALALLAMTACATRATEKTDNDKSTETEMNTDTKANDDVMVDIETTAGTVRVKLYGDTPAHRDNFVKLVGEGYYDGTLFHRVIKDFMIQAGDPDSRQAGRGQMLGSGGPDYTLPAEIVYPAHFHHRGVLAAARQGDQVNPERRSSGSQFYIVTGQVYNDSTINRLEQSLRVNRVGEIFQRLRAENHDMILKLSRNKDREGLDALRDQMIAAAEAEADREPGLTAEQRRAYTTVGGAPHLDGQYTVFGEVVDGMDVVDAIERVKTDRNDRPVDDVRIIKATVVK